MVGSDANLDGPETKVHGELTLKKWLFNLEQMSFGTLPRTNHIYYYLCLSPLSTGCDLITRQAVGDILG